MQTAALALFAAALLYGAPPAGKPQGQLNQTDEARFLAGAKHFQRHDYAAALASLSGLENGSHAERVLYIEEESYRLTGQADAARDAFHRLNTRFPDGPWIHMLMAAAYENGTQPEKAIAEYQAALAADSSLPSVRFALGYLYWRADDTEQARTFLSRELTITPCHSLAAFYLGEIARADRDLPAAESYYRKAASCDTHFGEARLKLGVLLGSLHRDNEALRQLRSASTLMPGDSAPHYQMGTLYRRIGKPARADAEYRIVRELKAKSSESDEKQLAR